MIVMKFGGTSVGSAAMMDTALDLATAALPRAPVMVSSAMTKVTDALVTITKAAKSGDAEAARSAIEKLIALHKNTASELLNGPALKACEEALDSLFTELTSIVRGLCLIREISPRSHDMVLSFGERLSTIILFHRARARGIQAELIDARDFVKTDETFGSAGLLKNVTNLKVSELVKPQKGKLIITQGFIASTEKGVTTTLGRGGSDYSATIIGAALGVEEVEIWTDVDGIMTTDPRIIPHALVLPEITYAEAAELAYFGAKVIHPSTIQPAIDLGIPVWVKNTKNPAAPGTKIVSETSSSKSGRAIQAIAGKKGITLITVRSTRMLNAFGFLRSIFHVFETHKVSVDLVATSEVSVTVTVEENSHYRSVVKELEGFAEVNIEEKQAIVCLVGKGLWKDEGFLSGIFAAMRGIPVNLITMGSSDINLSMVVEADKFEDAIKRLHDALFQR